MSWRADHRNAKKMMSRDPSSALALLERLAADAPPAKRVAVAGERAELLESLGRPDEAAEALDSVIAQADGPARVMLHMRHAALSDRAGHSERAAVEREALLGELDAELASGKAKGVTGVTMLLSEKATVLSMLGRPTDAARCKLQAYDVKLASLGDNAARAGLASTPFWLAQGGIGGFEYSAQFRRSYEKAQRDPVLRAQKEYIDDGTAAIVARCDRCKEPVVGTIPAKPMWGKSAWKTWDKADTIERVDCPRGHKLHHWRVIVKEDINSELARLGRG